MPASGAILTFQDLLQLRGICLPPKEWKLMRHKDSRPHAPDVLDLYYRNRNWLEEYQSLQSDDKAPGEGILSFLGIESNRALFVGAYRINARETVRTHDIQIRDVAPPLRPMIEQDQQSRDTLVRYSLDRDTRFEPLELRVVIDWGANAIAWHQWALDKEVVELRAPGGVEPFPGYGDLFVTAPKLRHIVAHAGSNPSWQHQLSASGGVYLLTDQSARGQLYVGSATGSGGLWSRWKTYVENDGLVGNVKLNQHLTDHPGAWSDFAFSILTTFSTGTSRKQGVKMENEFKLRLGTRAHGLTAN